MMNLLEITIIVMYVIDKQAFKLYSRYLIEYS